MKKGRIGTDTDGSSLTTRGRREGTKFYGSLLENGVAFLPCYILQAELSLWPPERVGN